MSESPVARLWSLAITAALAVGCAQLPRPGTHLPRTGDEIVVAGQFFHTGTPIVLWMDPGGYDAYRVERRFAPFEQSDWKSSTEKNPQLGTPNRYGMRRDGLSDWQIARMRGGGMDLLTLQGLVDQFVLHFDACGTSRQCFKVLHDLRCLSVHFMLDLDGTIYQTLDLKERAWHATSANSRSIGIEIANIGAYPKGQRATLDRWYKTDSAGSTHIRIPPEFEPSGIRTADFVARPVRPEPVEGSIQGQQLEQFDLTTEQYDALIKLTAALCRIFPDLECDYPRDEKNAPISTKLPEETLRKYRGLLGHYHIQANKVDPGPAFQWNKVVNGARKLMGDPR
jgi:N-acetylmuramoyl-L-alanine amidase